VTIWQRLTALLTSLWESQRAILAVKIGIAGGLAWWAGSLLPTSIDDYAYYAPLGAFSVMLSAVSDSWRDVLRIEAAIVAGITLASVFQWVAAADPITVGLVLAAGIGIASIPWFGAEHVWVPLGALFTLVFTTSGPFYAFGMAGQTLIGAVIGYLINVTVLPALGHRVFERNSKQLAFRLESRLQDLSQTMAERNNDENNVDKDWAGKLVELDDLRSQVRRGREHLTRAARGNPRARRWAASRRDLLSYGHMLESLTLQVQQLAIVLRELEDSDEPDIGDDLRNDVAALLETVAELLNDPTRGRTNQTRSDADKLRDRIDNTTFTNVQSRYLAGMLAIWAGRCAATISGRINDDR